jgi:hypothetical protein
MLSIPFNRRPDRFACKSIMKILLRIAAVLSFLFPFLCGAGLLSAALATNTASDFWIPAAVGSFLIGNAIFAGAILLFAAEKLSRTTGREL